MSTILDIGTIKYVNCPVWNERATSGIDVDDFGLDVLSRTFDVRPDQIQQFGQAFQKGVQDATFPWLYVVDRKINNVSGPMPEGIVTFKGATIPLGTDKNIARKVTTVSGLGTFTVSLLALDGSGATKNLTYRAPFSEWRYVSAQDPNAVGPRFSGILLQNNPQPIMVNQTGAPGQVHVIANFIYKPNQPPFKPDPKSYPFPFVGVTRIIPSSNGFQITQMGNVWTVVERNELNVFDYIVFYITQSGTVVIG